MSYLNPDSAITGSVTLVRFLSLSVFQFSFLYEGDSRAYHSCQLRERKSCKLHGLAL